jgi:hypothetical protein
MKLPTTPWAKQSPSRTSGRQDDLPCRAVHFHVHGSQWARRRPRDDLSLASWVELGAVTRTDEQAG